MQIVPHGIRCGGTTGMGAWVQRVLAITDDLQPQHSCRMWQTVSTSVTRGESGYVAARRMTEADRALSAKMAEAI